MKNRPDVPDQQINWKIPAKKTKSRKLRIRKNQTKQKKTIIPKTLESFNLLAIYDTMQYSH